LRRLEKYGITVNKDKRYFGVKPSGSEYFVPLAMAEDIQADYTFKTMNDTREIYVYNDGVYEKEGENVVRREARKRLGDKQKKHYVNETVGVIQDISITRRSKFDSNTNKIVVDNGILDLEKALDDPEDALEPHTPDFLATSKIPVKYDPEADCPGIREFIDDILDSERKKKTLIEFIGHAIYPGYPVQKALMLTGETNNGKSVFLNLVKDFVGHENVSGESLQRLNDNDFAASNLYGKLVNVRADLSGKEIKDTSRFKELTGEDKYISADVKHKDPIQFTNKATLMFSANKIPGTRYDKTDAFYKRWIIVKFPYRFVDNPVMENEKKRDTKILDKIESEEEFSGLLNLGN